MENIKARMCVVAGKITVVQHRLYNAKRTRVRAGAIHLTAHLRVLKRPDIGQFCSSSQKYFLVKRYPGPPPWYSGTIWDWRVANVYISNELKVTAIWQDLSYLATSCAQWPILVSSMWESNDPLLKLQQIITSSLHNILVSRFISY